jgi:probable rRNA maturation factor
MEINVSIEEGLEEYLGMNWLQSVAEQVLIAQNADSRLELGLVITIQEKVQQLNRSYLGKDEPTDVLAFSMLPEPLATGESEIAAPFVQPPDGVLHLGEVIVSYPQAVIQAEEHRHSVKKEVAVLIIHGVLHLLGYDHDKPELERQMRTREKEILSCIEGDLD